MTIKDLINITNRNTVICCFEQFTNNCEFYSKETAKIFDNKEVSMIDIPNDRELNIYYK